MVHPCFNPIAHFKYGRIHLPVAARCNIQCKYCIRRISKCEDRPGVSSAIHKVNDAVEWLRRNVKKNSELKVVGIAGPGDALANEETYKLFKIVDDEFPGLIKCLSTNGLLLQERVNALVNLNVRTVTVTVNTVNPKIGSKIYDWISYGGRMYYGVEGADILLHKQLEGIKRASKKGIAVSGGVAGAYPDELTIEPSAYNQKQFPGVYMNIYTQSDFLRMNDIKNNRFWRGVNIKIILPLDLLMQQNWHVNMQDNNGNISK